MPENKKKAKSNFDQMVYYPDIIVKDVQKTKNDTSSRGILHENNRYLATFSAPMANNRHTTFETYVTERHAADLQKMKEGYEKFSEERKKLYTEMQKARSENKSPAAVEAAERKYKEFTEKRHDALIFGVSVNSNGTVRRSLIVSAPDNVAKFEAKFPQSILEDARKSKKPLVRLTVSVGPTEKFDDNDKRRLCIRPHSDEGKQVLAGVLPNDKTFTRVRITLTDNQMDALKDNLGKDHSLVNVITPFTDMTESVDDQRGSRTIFVNRVSNDSISILFKTDENTFNQRLAERRDAKMARVAEFKGLLDEGKSIAEAAEAVNVKPFTGCGYIGILVASGEMSPEDGIKAMSTMVGKADKKTVKSIEDAISAAGKVFADMSEKSGAYGAMKSALPAELAFVASYVGQLEETKAALASAPEQVEEAIPDEEEILESMSTPGMGM